jgi:hypothetical protein
LQPNHPTRNAQGSVTAGLSAIRGDAALNSPVRFPGEDGGRTLAEMAQRDLDAALQLLADRAQFITGATGAAIALRCDGRKDMLCRASAGSNAPELGALLSTEFGLSGESVRTRQLLRCDDAARDARVNQEACRQLGIASVVVMPVVNDDEVLGVFELFSGRANAFGDRDLSAVQRLTEMVETAVRLANASLSLPKQLEQALPVEAHGDGLEKKIVAVKSVAEEIEETSGEILDEDVLLDALEGPAAKPQNAIPGPAGQSSFSSSSGPSSPCLDPDADNIIEMAPALAPKDALANPAEPAADKASGSNAGEAVAGNAAAEVAAAEIEEAKKPLLWSAANAAAEPASPGEADQSHVPPVLRGLRKCEACGFPISGGRTLCVECEEKKWRGQLPKPQAATPMPTISEFASPRPEGQALAAAAQSGAIATAPAPVAVSAVTQPAVGAEQRAAEKTTAPEAMPVVISVPTASPVAELVLSAGLEPSQSWLARNRYIVGVVLAVAVAVTAVFLLR